MRITGPRLSRIGVFVVLALLPFGHTAAFLPSSNLQHAPVDYYKTTPTDPIAQLQQRLADGRVRLERDPDHGYLKSLLQALDIDISSQVLVGSKTSLQRDRISPATPRAIYFNDDSYVAWVQRSRLLELSAVDPQLGATFYTVDQGSDDASAANALTREYDLCLQCHNPPAPGHVMVSLVPDQTGWPLFHDVVFEMTDRSPWEERWGGWFVTGTHGDLPHLGNLIIERAASSRAGDAAFREAVADRKGANVTDLSPFLDATRYLTPHSDIVALMIMTHQVDVQNLMTRLNYAARKAIHVANGANATDSYREDADRLINAMLFVGEARWDGRISGTSMFADDFQRRGPKDSQGRSLRAFDLSRRLFRYPLSYLIYSKAFFGLPGPARRYVVQGLAGVLTGRDSRSQFAHLSMDDREAILQILEETHPDFAAVQPWR